MILSGCFTTGTEEFMEQNRPQSLLGDTPTRDYSEKLRLFNAYASPELCQAMDGLELSSGMRVLDAGCGTGETLSWLDERVSPGGAVWGIDLSRAHLHAVHAMIKPNIAVAQADLLRPPFPRGFFDLIWSVNTINHLKDPVDGIRLLETLLRPAGRIAIGQSSLVPDMYFAWDSRLERVTNEAVRQYYRDRYHLSERDLTSVRSLVGTLRRSGLKNVRAKSHLIERISPLLPPDEAYLLRAIFQGTFGEKLRPYLCPEDFEELSALCDPDSSAFALRRPDFHFIQTFTLVVGETAAKS
jgi:SAM-dependent methyltransferase